MTSPPVDAKASVGADIVGRHVGGSRLALRTVWIAVLTLVSRLLGFVREILAAYLFGDQSPVYDAFLTAWRVPNLFRRLLGEGALSTSLARAITEEDGDRGEQAGDLLFVRTMRRVLWILVVLAGVLMLGAWLAPDRLPFTGFAWLGSDPEPVRELTVRITPFVVLICLSALAGGALFVRGHYTAPNLAPVVLNVVWIAALVLLGAHFGWKSALGGEASYERHFDMARALAIGVLVAGVAQLAIQVPALLRAGLIGRSELGAVEPVNTPKDVLRRALPLAFGAAVYQINVMIDGLMAEGLLPNGGPTAYYYANRLQQFPLALVAIAATNAVFPALFALGHRRELGQLAGLHRRTQRSVLFFALPAMFGLFALAEPIVSVCFEHGAFGASGVERTTHAVRALAFAIVPAGAVGLVARTYYALGDMRTPVVYSAFALVVNAMLNVVLIAGIGMDVEGLALATASSSWLHLVLLLPGLRKRHGLPGPSPEQRAGTLRALLQIVLASVTSALAGYGVETWTSPVLSNGAGLALGIAAAVIVYFGLAHALGLSEMRRFTDRFSARAR